MTRSFQGMSAALVVALALLPAKVFAQPDLARVERRLIEGTNTFRRDAGLGPVGVDPALERAARGLARHMARTDEFGHEADGRKASERARASGYDYCRLAENIAYQYSSADFSVAELVRRNLEGWKASPGHRRNLLEPQVLDTGVAVERSARTGRYYAVQMFGRTASDCRHQPRGSTR